MLSHFRVTAKLGAGGMGDVYRAEDTKLGRQVAIKLLGESWAADPERLARFEREAKLLASLNHPNIASIYAFETADRAVGDADAAQPESVHFLVMELVEGETLADRLRDGELAPEVALPIALQIARALETAHEHNVIHRDLKPGNVMVTPQGQVKVLDFGLAKAMTAVPSTDPAAAEGSAAAEAPTLTAEMTRAGMVLGTAAYMSPEQVRAASLDKRTDIWSFGVVLYEMLAGKRLFDGTSISDTMAEVLKSEPDLQSLPADLPETVRSLIARCLTKDVNRRLRDIGEARIVLEDTLAGDLASAGPAAGPIGKKRASLVPWLLAAVFAVVALVAVWPRRESSPLAASANVTRTSVFLPPEAPLALTQTSSLAISPDGSTIAFVGGTTGTRKLYVRPLDASKATPIEGTDGAESPVFSPSGEWIGFVAGTRLLEVAVTGGPTQTISFMAPVSRGLDWVREGTIIVSPNKTSGVMTTSTADGHSEWLTRPAVQNSSGQCWPEMLPDGRRLLVTVLAVDETSWDEAQIVLADTTTNETVKLVEGGSQARYLPTGHIVFAHEGKLLGVPFDLESGTVTGPLVVLLDDLLTNPASGAAQFAIADNGTLVYAKGGSQPVSNRHLLWVDRKGNKQPVLAEPRLLNYPRISPDGHQIVMTIESASDDVWLLDLERDVFQRLTFGHRQLLPSWGPGTDQITYTSTRGALPTIYIRSLASGEERQLTSGALGSARFSGDWSPDGSTLAAMEVTYGSNWNILLIGSDGQEQHLLDSPFTESAPTISPDGRWLAYVSEESGRAEIYIASLPKAERRIQVSTHGGTQPVWSRSGTSLYFLADDGIREVEIETTPGLAAGVPALVVEGSFVATGSMPYCSQFDVGPDDQRFLVMEEEPVPEVTRLEVVLDWFAELERKMAAGR